MDYRFFGTTGIKISALGLGTMTFGAEADERTSADLFAHARNAGVTFFDTADVYAGGKSEEILGRLVGSCRDEVVLATKAYFPTGADPNARGSSRYHLRRAVEASLRRLGTDRIDVFFLHRFDDETALEDVLRTLDDLVRAGMILHPAASNFAAWQVARAVGVAERAGFARVACIQPMYNLLKRQAEVEILPLAQAEHLAVVPYSPLAGGLLSGKYGVGRRPDKGRIVDNKMYQTRYAAGSNYAIAEGFAALAAEVGLHPASLAIAWVRSHPAVTAPLVGARDLAQLDVALGALDIDMTEELRARISSLSPEPPPATDRNEESSTFNFGAR